jgi:ribonuclease P protein component
MSSKFTFPSQEHLKSQKKIQQLFSTGHSCAAYPMVLVWQVTDVGTVPVQMAVSVSKKKFKKAVDRNRIKRQMREVWRLHKHEITEQIAQQNQHCACMIIYTAKEFLPYQKIEKSMRKIIKKWSSTIAPSEN